MHLRLTLWLWLFLISTGNLSAQFIFQNLNESDGLLTKFSRCLYKDKQGFLWIGSANGLYRYDGNFVKRYEGQKNGRVVTTAIEPIDGESSLLLGTTNGIKVFNKESSSYKTDARFAELSKDNIIGIKPDGYGRLWILCDRKIFLFSNNKVTSIDQVIPGAGRLSEFEPYLFNRGTFCWDSYRNGFWVGGTQSYFIDCVKNVVYDSTNCPFYAPLLSERSVTAIALDSRNNMWYSTHTDPALNYVDFKRKQVTTYPEVQGKKIAAASNLLFIDKRDRLWISTLNYAEYFKEPGKPILPIPYSQDAPYSIAYRRFYDVIEDSEGNLWFATLNGVSKLPSNSPFQKIYKLPSFPFFLETGFAQVNHMVIEDSLIMVSKEDGIIKLQRGRQDFKRYIISNDSLRKNEFLMAAKVGEDWWVCGAAGVFIIPKKSDKIEHCTQIERKARSGFTNLIFVDQEGKIWFHVEDSGLYRFNQKTNLCEHFDGKSSKNGPFQYTNVSCFAKLRNGNIVFGMDHVGLLNFDIRNDKFSLINVEDPKNFRPGKIIEDKNGDMWVSMLNRGVYKMNRRGELLDSINYNLDFSFALSVNLAIDARGALWGGSADGLFFTYPGSHEVTRVKIELGKTLQDYWNHLTVDRDRVYAVMLDHIVEIDPFKFSITHVQRPPLITSLRVFGHEISDFSRSTIELRADQDFITFQYTSLYHRDIPSLQYSYQLVGIDESWVNAGRNLRVSYNSLEPGWYTFKVRSTDENGRWMQQITAIKVHILPSWWQTWWFLMLVGCLSFLFLYMAYSGYIGRKQKKELSKTIEYFANSVYGENAVNEICWDIARNCTSQLHFEDCTVFLWDEQRQKLVQKATYTSKDAIEKEIEYPLELSLGEGIVGFAAENKRTVVIPDTLKDGRYIPVDTKKLSEIAVPIMHDGKVIGVLDSKHSKGNFFNEEHARALTTIASISGSKIAEAQAEEATAQKEIMLFEINRMLAESQLMALRAQMNPHFVFNCLNSIQECIVTEKYGEASKYLNKFSKLFRMVLNNSDRNLVTVEEEKNVLQLYLELEQMRFEQSFVYSIEVDEDLEADDILLPSMLLQPYVENAIWHGLMHKNGNRELKISFSRISDEVFQCVIEDNGIGRKKSFEIKARNALTKKHQSKGLQIAKDRLDLISRQGRHASVKFVDKYDDEENATGTTVIVELSTSLDNV
ncbi:histidine kinase [Dyadobacter sp. CY261]|uniref:histidine kinase n=1 Tax=Dyadobacter sp. CY261 TaxID=2907203 RepID=UPI001F2719A8|nr:histidine kinase [Dyadobacter sp. CY261]MCF0068908.1 histidine kinase [Dyadobacter sp. CY261]